MLQVMLVHVRIALSTFRVCRMRSLAAHAGAGA